MNQISDKSLNLTETAVRRIKTAMKANEDLGSKFRVYVTGGGCSGFQYGFKFDSDVAFDDDVIEFASHSERYSKLKNDPWINQKLINSAIEGGKPDVIVLHEKAWAKKCRNLLYGNWSALREPTQKQWIEKFYPQLIFYNLNKIPQKLLHLADPYHPNFP